MDIQEFNERLAEMWNRLAESRKWLAKNRPVVADRHVTVAQEILKELMESCTIQSSASNQGANSV